MKKVSIFIVVAIVAICFLSCNDKHLSQQKKEINIVEQTIITPQEAIAVLSKGNQRYVKDSNIFPHISHSQMTKTANKQTPFAVVVTCSDSRVPVELIFDEGIGDIFVIRTAGNSVNDNVIKGSIEYAVEELGVKTVVIMGHESCGGVSAAIKNLNPNNEIGNLLRIIRNDVKPYVGKIDSLTMAIKMNVNVQVDRVKKIPIVEHLIKQEKLSVVGAYYNIHNGSVEFRL